LPASSQLLLPGLRSLSVSRPWLATVGCQQRCFAGETSRSGSPATLNAVHTITAIYPGSFDPVTNGHLDLVTRGAKLFDRLIVAVLRNSAKNPLFTVEERVEMLREGTSAFQNVEIATFEGLLVDFAREQDAHAVLRGIRAISDYEYELQMAHMNRRLNPDVETIFLMPDAKYSYVSSRLVKEVFRVGGSVDGLVPQLVIDRLKRRVEQG
jgi:pantetheine-phosphate adenylyltransferase